MTKRDDMNSYGYYVYVYMDPLTGPYLGLEHKPFYIGKGHGHTSTEVQDSESNIPNYGYGALYRRAAKMKYDETYYPTWNYGTRIFGEK